MRRALPLLLVLLLAPSAADARRTWSPCVLSVPPADDGVLLAEFTTRFKARVKRRAANVRLAALRLDGVTIPPHGRLSYNATVGPRSEGRGFRAAPVIDNGQLTEKTGGGVCQPSSTLHAAALLAGLGVEKRQSHLWASAYIAAGFDATVVWAQKDLVITNPYPFTVRVAADTGVGFLTIRILGDAPRPGWVELRTKELDRVAHKVVREPDATLPIGREVLVNQGSDGLKVARSRWWFLPGRRPRVEPLSTDVYAPHDTLLKIGTPSQASILPELGTHDATSRD